MTRRNTAVTPNDGAAALKSGAVGATAVDPSAVTAASRQPRYTVNPAERIRELLFRDEIPDTAELTYSFSEGYERLDYRESENHGSIHYAGAYHPDGMCDGEHICSYCGRVHTYG